MHFIFSSYHQGCLTPPLARVPRGDWKCPSCMMMQAPVATNTAAAFAAATRHVSSLRRSQRPPRAATPASALLRSATVVGRGGRPTMNRILRRFRAQQRHHQSTTAPVIPMPYQPQSFHNISLQRPLGTLGATRAMGARRSGGWDPDRCLCAPSLPPCVVCARLHAESLRSRQQVLGAAERADKRRQMHERIQASTPDPALFRALTGLLPLAKSEFPAVNRTVELPRPLSSPAPAPASTPPACPPSPSLLPGPTETTLQPSEVSSQHLRPGHRSSCTESSLRAAPDRSFKRVWAAAILFHVCS